MAARYVEGVVPPERPVLVLALEGWIDAGFAAATASGALLGSLETELYATFDADKLLDQRARRPRMTVDHGVVTGVVWPAPTVRVATDRNGNGIALLLGPEPDYHWHGFIDDVVELATGLRCRLVVGLGGFPAATPHSRPVRLAATATDAALAAQVGFVPGAIEAPAGVADMICVASAEAGLPALGLWARVPHYVSAMPFPAAAVALLESLESLGGLSLDLKELRDSAEVGREKVDRLIAQSSEHVDMVRQLEQQVDEARDDTLVEPGRLPSGDELAAELERFLRGEMQ
jgi:predicted ATP-grasp superfamily ATP-dependent carboligase